MPTPAIPAWKIFFSDIVKTALAVLAGLFYVEPALVAGLIVTFIFNVLAGAAKGLIQGDRFARHLLRVTGRRALVYVLILPPAIVLSNMASVLQLLAAMIFAAVACYEFITASAIAAYIYEPWRAIHDKIAAAIRAKVDLVPEEEDA